MYSLLCCFYCSCFLQLMHPYHMYYSAHKSWNVLHATMLSCCKSDACKKGSLKKSGAINVGMSSKPPFKLEFFSEHPTIGKGQLAEVPRYQRDAVRNLDVLRSAVRVSLDWTARLGEVILFHDTCISMNEEEVTRKKGKHTETLAYTPKNSARLLEIFTKGGRRWDAKAAQLGFRNEELNIGSYK